MQHRHTALARMARTAAVAVAGLALATRLRSRREHPWPRPKASAIAATAHTVVSRGRSASPATCASTRSGHSLLGSTSGTASTRAATRRTAAGGARTATDRRPGHRLGRPPQASARSTPTPPAVSSTSTAQRRPARAPHRRVGDVTDNRPDGARPSTHRHEARLVWAVSSADGDGAQHRPTSTPSPVRSSRPSSTASSATPPSSPRVAARVFDPNPVVKLQDESLRDHATMPRRRPAAGLLQPHAAAAHGNGHTPASAGGCHHQQGPGRVANRPISYNRANDNFEQVMAYYAIDAGAGLPPAARASPTSTTSRRRSPPTPSPTTTRSTTRRPT